MYFTDFMYAPADADPPGCSKLVLTADAAPDRQPSAAQKVAGAETARPKPVVKSSCCPRRGACALNATCRYGHCPARERISKPSQDPP